MPNPRSDASSARVSGAWVVWPESIRTWPSRLLSRMLFDDSQSRTKTWSCGGRSVAVILRPPHSCEPPHELLHERHAVGKRRRGALDAHAIRPGKAHAAVVSDDRDERCRVERRML